MHLRIESADGAEPGQGYPLRPYEIGVGLTDDDFTIELVVDLYSREIDAGRAGIERTLTADEARNLAAMLNHAADMTDRRAGLR